MTPKEKAEEILTKNLKIQLSYPSQYEDVVKSILEYSQDIALDRSNILVEKNQKLADVYSVFDKLKKLATDQSDFIDYLICCSYDITEGESKQADEMKAELSAINQQII